MDHVRNGRYRFQLDFRSEPSPTHPDQTLIVPRLLFQREHGHRPDKIARRNERENAQLQEAITSLRRYRSLNNPRCNAIIEKHVRDMNEQYCWGKHEISPEIAESILACARTEVQLSFLGNNPLDLLYQGPQNLERIAEHERKFSLIEFLDVVESPNPADLQRIKQALFSSSTLSPEEQDLAIASMTWLARKYLEAPPDKRAGLLEKANDGVQQFCIAWMEAMEHGVDLHQLPGCGKEIDHIARTVSPPAPQTLPSPPGARKARKLEWQYGSGRAQLREITNREGVRSQPPSSRPAPTDSAREKKTQE